jgi:hypothetical protein
VGVRFRDSLFPHRTVGAPVFLGALESNSGVEYLLVEAKAHVEEIQSSCGAREQGGLDVIRKAFDAAINANGLAVSVESWLKPYYQYANKFAHLHFLLQHDTPVRLLFIYSCGDDWHGKTLSNGRPPNCPKSEQESSSCLRGMHQHLALTGGSELEKRVHHLFCLSSDSDSVESADSYAA